MPLFKRSRPAPCPSHDAPFSHTLFDTSYHLRASSPQPLNLLHLTKHIASNVLEARRLLGLKSALLHSGDQEWMAGVIRDNEAALHDIARLIRPARVAPQAAILDIPLLDNNNNRSAWILEDNRQVRTLHQRLRTLHGSLMSVLSVLYLRDLRWIYVSKPEPREREREAPPLPPAAYDSVAVAVEDPLAKRWRQDGTITPQQQHVHGGDSGAASMPIPATASRFAIDNPYTWQPRTPPPGEERLQHSRSDPTPVPQTHPDVVKPSLYRHETISSAYLANCRLTHPWTTEFAVPAEEEEMGVKEDGSSGRNDDNDDDNNDDFGLELPPSLSTIAKRRRWSADVLKS